MPMCDGVRQTSTTSVMTLRGWLALLGSLRVSTTRSDGGLFSVMNARLPSLSKMKSRTSVPCANVDESTNCDCCATVMTLASATRKVATSGLTFEVTYHSECGSDGDCCARAKAPWRPVGSGGKNSVDSESSACDGGTSTPMTETCPVARCDTSRRRLVGLELSTTMPNGSAGSCVLPLLFTPTVQLGWYWQ